MNSGRINDICYKVNFITNYTHFTILDRHFIKTDINIIIFDTFEGTVLLRDLRISHQTIESNPSNTM